jgi:hypothetical protein
MFAMDVPYVPVQDAPMVLAQSEKSGTSVAPDFILNSCKETEHTRDGSISPFGGIHPAYMLRNYLASVGSNVKPEDIKVTLLSAPQHGKLNGYLYDPAPGYLGDDRATFMAEYKGKHYKIIVTIKVLVAVDENSPTCPSPELIKVNKNKKAISDASPYQLNSFTVTFGDLPGGAVGQTTGEGANTSITLDSTAAGHGWYIDATPLTNSDDYLSFRAADQALHPNNMWRNWV